MGPGQEGTASSCARGGSGWIFGKIPPGKGGQALGGAAQGGLEWPSLEGSLEVSEGSLEVSEGSLDVSEGSLDIALGTRHSLDSLTLELFPNLRNPGILQIREVAGKKGPQTTPKGKKTLSPHQLPQNPGKTRLCRFGRGIWAWQAGEAPAAKFGTCRHREVAPFRQIPAPKRCPGRGTGPASQPRSGSTFPGQGGGCGGNPADLGCSALPRPSSDFHLFPGFLPFSSSPSSFAELQGFSRFWGAKGGVMLQSFPCLWKTGFPLF
ncbi:uncharacterized protein LOC116436395 [Corvus moneduloides]|uniref:uncharacterized protein LOC116436395 n=1 Tax=Corvus moneduloides TaxID=1196302 RepID=UPI001362F501|nr:uncharacterized protein LOC116436395 [Corvus moneduloides]